MQSRRQLLILLATLTIALVATLGAATTSSAATQATPPDSAPLKELPDLVLSPWLETQTSRGYFKRPSGSPAVDGYANVGIAYAMLLEAVRSGDDRYFNAAIKAINWSNRTRLPMNGIFYRMFSAAAYNVARANFANRSAFKRIRPRWANKLRAFPYQRGVLGSHYRYNKNLVEALEVIELYNTKLRSNNRKAVLNNRSAALKKAVRLLNVWVPRNVTLYSMVVGPAEGWPVATRISEMSDPPFNPPAYNALSAALYARAYARLPFVQRTERMRQTSERMIDGVVARMAPDGDIAFDGRSQEQAWALSSAAYAAWNASDFEDGPTREVHLAFARRAVSRLETVHVTSKSSFGFVLTPAAGCCDRQDNPPGQDHYYDVAKYSGLTALTMGWALEDRPDDAASGSDVLPTDRPSNLVYKLGGGRFQQHRGANTYWLLRMQSDYFDARSDMGVAVLKIQDQTGNWIDAVPPRPYTGGHHRPADPAAPCLIYRRGCAYLELHGGTPQGTDGSYFYSARWRTARGTLVRRGSATVSPTAEGLTLSWSASPTDQFKLDTFLPAPSCVPGVGVVGPNVTVAISGQVRCGVFADYYAGGSMTTMRKTRLVANPIANNVTVTYTARTG